MNRWDYDWPKASSPTEGWGLDARRSMLRADHMRAWRPHRPLMALLEDHYARHWSRNERTIRTWDEEQRRFVEEPFGDGVKWCRRTPATDLPGRVRLEDGLEVAEVRGCNETPYCPACNDDKARRRGKKLLDKIIQATPPNEDVSCQLVTLGVVERRPHGTGIVETVAQDWRSFRDAAYRVIEWMYGEGVGAFLTYQEYGQKLLVQKHTHVHAIVHHWREEGGEARKIQKFDINEDPGLKRRAMQKWFDELRPLYANVPGEKPEDWMSGYDLDLRYSDHPGKISKLTKYVVRELIDMRELRYDRDAQAVTVYPYKDREESEDGEGGPVTAPVATVKANFEDYARRVGRWGTKPIVHAAYGNMSDRSVGETIRRIGRGKTHEEGCWCRECSTWRVLWEDAPTSRRARSVALSGRDYETHL